MSEDVRKTIINCAAEIFNRFGFKKTTMDEIAASVRKGKSSLYYYFKSKEEVFEAVVETEAAELVKRVKAKIDAEDDPRQKLTAYIKERIHGVRELVNFYNALKSEVLTHYAFIENIRAKYDAEERTQIASILNLGIERDLFIIKDVQLTADAIAIVMKGLEIPLITTELKGDVYKEIDDIMEILFKGLEKR